MMKQLLIFNKQIFLLILLILILLSGCKETIITDEILEPEMYFSRNTEVDLPVDFIPDDIKMNKSVIERSFLTQTPEKTKMQALTELVLDQVAYYLIETVDEKIILENVSSDEKDLVTTGGHFIQWEQSGCSFYYVDYDKNIYKKTIGEEIQQPVIIRDELIKKFGPIFMYPHGFSNDGYWTSFWQGEGSLISGYDMGDRYSRVEKQNVLIVSTNFQQRLISISENGGGWVAEWSPVEPLIAYSDFDDQGILQVFTFSPDGGEKTQRTQFMESTSLLGFLSGLNINNIIWSTDGKKLGINYEIISDEDYSHKFLVVDLTNNQIIYDQEGVWGLWWIEEEMFIQSNYIDEKIFEVYNLEFQNIMTTIYESHFGKINQIFPFVNNYWVGLRTANTSDIYIFDIYENTLHFMPFFIEINDAYTINTTNSKFHSLTDCNKKP